ncbi:hypothetical protein NE237_023767 [Protea cynaroides]|uniref:Uncharacterized protein n=1 Tax=Protea cynaroides TaxID=273540 RepID=A0A9Q0K6S6_9MAGN|nr:hypothetical protein NE237_023767 [Protea cynaroides]
MLASTLDKDFFRLIAFDVQISKEYSKDYTINGYPPSIAGRDGKSGIQTPQVPEWIALTFKRGGAVIISRTRNVQGIAKGASVGEETRGIRGISRDRTEGAGRISRNKTRGTGRISRDKIGDTRRISRDRTGGNSEERTIHISEDETEGFSVLQIGILSVDETMGVSIEDETGGTASDNSMHTNSSDGEWFGPNI